MYCHTMISATEETNAFALEYQLKLLCIALAVFMELNSFQHFVRWCGLRDSELRVVHVPGLVLKSNEWGGVSLDVH